MPRSEAMATMVNAEQMADHHVGPGEAREGTWPALNRTPVALRNWQPMTFSTVVRIQYAIFALIASQNNKNGVNVLSVGKGNRSAAVVLRLRVELSIGRLKVRAPT